MGPFLSEQSFGDLVLEIVSDHIENNFIWPVASSPFFLLISQWRNAGRAVSLCFEPHPSFAKQMTMIA